MAKQITEEQLHKMSEQDKDALILSMQSDLASLNDKLESLIEQIRISNQDRFGSKSEKMNVIDGQYNLFNECEYFSDLNIPEPDIEEILPKKPRKKKQRDKRVEGFADFPEESHDYTCTEASLDDFYGKNNWRELPVEIHKDLRYEPAKWFVEKHIVHVYVGTDGDNQDVFMRGKCPKRLLRTSFVTPSLLAAVLNGKYTNAMPLERISAEFGRNGLGISRQTLANWVIRSHQKFLAPVVSHLEKALLECPVNQCDETRATVVNDKSASGSVSGWMWVHRTSEHCKDKPVILYEYNKSRAHDVPLAFYKDYKGILVSDGLEQYHLVSRKLPNVTNANCWVHARRDFANAIKAIGKTNEELVRNSIAHQALLRIGLIYKYEGLLKDLSPEERLEERRKTIAPLVDEFFAWVKARLNDTSCLPKGETAKGLHYCIDKEQYLRVFLTDGNVPIDNSAAERSIRPFTVGRKNWMIINSVNGAKASAAAYSIVETAKANGVNIYQYFVYLFEVLKEQPFDEDGNIDLTDFDMESIMPWSKTLPEKCYKVRR